MKYLAIVIVFCLNNALLCPPKVSSSFWTMLRNASSWSGERAREREEYWEEEMKRVRELNRKEEKEREEREAQIQAQIKQWQSQVAQLTQQKTSQQ